MQSSIALQDTQGLPFRLALNEALQTLITQNAGPTEPNPTYAFQPWVDTTTGILKQRNAANNDWVEILDLATGRPVGSVAQTSPTGALLLAEGTDTQRPAPEDIPAGVAAVRGNSTSLTDRFLEFWNRATDTWDALASRKWVTDLIAKLFSPTITGSAVLTGANNKLVMAGVVTELGLEKGDVIRIDGAGGINAKLRTVESIVNNGELILNYEHCGIRGNGTLKLQDFTGAVTITRLAKWYNAAEGLGQDWVTLTAFRTIGTDYLNSTNRSIGVCASTDAAPTGGAKLIVNGVVAASTAFVNGGDGSANAPVSLDATYRFAVSAIDGFYFAERR